MAAPALPDLSGAIDAADDAARAARDRLEATRDQLAERAAAVRSEVADRLEEVEPGVKRAQLGLWSGMRGFGTALAALPDLVFRILRALSAAGDVLLERRDELTERGRDLAGAVPPSRRQLRRSRARSTGYAGAGFVVGVLVGWLLARRGQPEIVYEETVTAHLDAAPVTPGGPGDDDVTISLGVEPGDGA